MDSRVTDYSSNQSLVILTGTLVNGNDSSGKHRQGFLPHFLNDHCETSIGLAGMVPNYTTKQTRCTIASSFQLEPKYTACINTTSIHTYIAITSSGIHSTACSYKWLSTTLA